MVVFKGLYIGKFVEGGVNEIPDASNEKNLVVYLICYLGVKPGYACTEIRVSTTNLSTHISEI